MGKNINQIATGATSVLSTDKMYIGRSPFGLTDDRYILGSSLIKQFGRQFVTVGAGGSYDYVNIGAAVAANQYNMLVVTAIAETADVQFSSNGDYHIVFAPNTSVNMSAGGAEWQFKRLNGTTANLLFDNMTVLYSYTSGKACLADEGSGSGNLNVRNFRFVNTSTADDCPFSYSSSNAQDRQFFWRGIIELPNARAGGLDTRNGILSDIQFISGGSSCSLALSALNASLTDIYFKGVEWGTTTTANLEICGVNGLYADADSGNTPMVRVDCNTDTSLENVFAYNGAKFGINLLTTTSLTQFDVGPDDAYFKINAASRGCSVSNGTAPSPNIPVGSKYAKISNVYFTSTDDAYIESAGILMNNINFGGNCILNANNIVLNGFSCGPGGSSTYTATIPSGKQKCTIVNGNVEVAVVDNSGNTTNKIDYQLW